jgi:hypothetical protein
VAADPSEPPISAGKKIPAEIRSAVKVHTKSTITDEPLELVGGLTGNAARGLFLAAEATGTDSSEDDCLGSSSDEFCEGNQLDTGTRRGDQVVCSIDHCDQVPSYRL